jgi:glycosyltransferase involved in cell wall biosynthesis
MNVSIIFSSYNGALTLPLMLEALCAMNSPSGVEWEIIAVNNNSKDRTQEILLSYTDRLPLKVLFEAKQGKNVALNSAVAIAKGDLLIFTDDDVLPATDWLQGYCTLMEQYPDVDLFGGKIEPHWIQMPNKSLLDEIPLGIAYAITPDDLRDGEVLPGKIWGPNMAVRKRVFRAGLDFNENIGPTMGSYIMGSETDFLERAVAKGYRTYFYSRLIVKHIIRPFQIEKDWLKNRAFKAGRGIIHKEVHSGKFQRVSDLCGFPRWAVFMLLKYWISMSLKKCLVFISGYYKNLWNFYLLLGLCHEYKQHLRRQ